MVNIRLIPIVLLLFCSFLKAQAQVEYLIVSGEKEVYEVNEEVKVQFTLHVDQKACKDGMEKTGVYVSGLEIISKSAWIELTKGTWQINLVCRVKGNKKGTGLLTVVRKNDRDNLFSQIKFNINQHGSIGSNRE